MDRQKYSVLLHRSTVFFSVLILAVTFNANAANIKIHVLDSSKNSPLKNMAVCLGTTANIQQFGAVRTDANGDVFFSNLPRTPLLLTVSGSQHKGLQRIIPASGSNLVRIVHLPLGGLGPACDAAPAISEVEELDIPGLRITGVSLDQGHKNTSSRSIVISSRIFGEPTHYRVSENPEFKGSDWIEYQKTPLFTLTKGDGQKKVYFQVRRAFEMNGNIIQTASNIASDRITLKTQ